MNTILVCQSTPKRSFEIWRIILITYKVLVQISAVPLAFAIRKVQTKGLNDSKYLVSIVYITSISLAVTIVCFAALYEKVNTSAAIYSLGAWVTSTVILCFMFIPKVRSKTLVSIFVLPGIVFCSSSKKCYFPNCDYIRYFLNNIVIICIASSFILNIIKVHNLPFILGVLPIQ